MLTVATMAKYQLVGQTLGLATQQDRLENVQRNPHQDHQSLSHSYQGDHQRRHQASYNLKNRLHDSELPSLPTPPSPERSPGPTPPRNPIDRPSTSRDLISIVANVPPKTSEFEIKIPEGLRASKTQVHHNTSLLLQIVKKTDVQQTVDADNDDNKLPVLPIKTMVQLEGVENALKVDTTKNLLSQLENTVAAKNLRTKNLKIQLKIGCVLDLTEKMDESRGGKERIK
ncbi:unnamed protein product [Mytilus coruscus]|uniref:Uncharacterized protein n=1 Tax=Mytilus coruscus TaxID=42192 RepID=A0A6J8B3W1_MYTCO|nr:unnamed protein product [Mytilus coruscus]